MDDRFEIGAHTTSYRTFDGESVFLQVVTTLPRPKSADDWKLEPYRGLQEKIEAYRATHEGIEIKIDFRDMSGGRSPKGVPGATPSGDPLLIKITASSSTTRKPR